MSCDQLLISRHRTDQHQDEPDRDHQHGLQQVRLRGRCRPHAASGCKVRLCPSRSTLRELATRSALFKECMLLIPGFEDC